MNYAWTILVIFLITQRSGQKLLLPEKETTSPISKCVLYILNKYFINSIKISIKYSNQKSSIISEMIRKIDSPKVINLDEMPETEGIDIRIPSDVSIKVGDSIDILTFLNKTKWTHTTQFLIIMTKSETSEENMTKIFWQFWANNIVNVILLSLDNDDVYIYTFIPFNRYDCAIHKPVLVATWKSGRMIAEKDIIQRERVTNLNGCTLNVSIINIRPGIIFAKGENITGVKSADGIEGSILMEISKILNFKLSFSEPKDGKAWGRVHPPHGAAGEVSLKKSHLACGWFSEVGKHKYVDVTVPVSCIRECISWAVPIGAKKSQVEWISLLISGFSYTVWYLIAATLILAIGIFRILSKVSINDRVLFTGNMQIIFYILKVSLGEPVKEPKSSHLKVLFFTWLWYCFIIMTAYQALMGSKLTVPYRQANINTFKDLFESDLHITAELSVFKTLAYGRKGKEIKAIAIRLEKSSFNPTKANLYFKEAVEQIISAKDIAHMWSSTSFMYNVIIHPKAKGLVHFMKECIYQYYPVMLLQKNCPFTSRVNRIIRALSEGGIICKWRKQYVYDIPEVEPEVRKLSLNRMTGSFVIFGAGMGGAVITFFAEHAFYWYSSKKSNLRTIIK